MVANGNNDGAPRTIQDFSIPQFSSRQSCIVYPELDATSSYEIKDYFINMLPKFSGDENQDASEHVDNFLDICGTHNIKGVSDEFIRLKLFPFSLMGDARTWFKTLPARSITSWTQLSIAGNILGKEPEQATTIIENVVANSSQWDSRELTRNSAYEVSSSNEVAALSRKLDAVVNMFSRNAEPCGICATQTHPTHLCPQSEAYLDTKNARITYQEQARTTTQVTDPIPPFNDPKANEQIEKAPVDISQEHTPAPAKKDQANIIHTSPEDLEVDHDSMGHSVFNNIEISMVHVLPVEFQPTASQPIFLDRDVVAEEAPQVNFMATEENQLTTKEDKLKAALAELFPRSSSANLHHLKSLYVTAYIEGIQFPKSSSTAELRSISYPSPS
ncbi:uncharacterized protein [Malus domestica]|uniref:uncharacterized protein n=1 Tax=Malus domestica TaxID=3750 RepID=UPI003976E492